jgi:ABC-type sugar transport system substrate-binding protein
MAASTCLEEEREAMAKLANWRLVVALMAIVALAVTVTACGGGSSSSSESTTAAAEEEGEAGTEEAASAEEGEEAEGEKGEAETVAEVVPAPPTEPLDEFPVTEPIKEKPPAKQNVIWLACSLPSCQGDLSVGYKKAAEALGWGFEQINYNPLKAAEAVQTAVNKDPDSIFITGIPPAAFEAQAKEAIKKEIPIFSGFDLTEPEPEKNGIYYQYLNAAGYGSEAKKMSDWVINDSGGKAHVLTVVIEEYPILVSEVESIEEAYGEGCPECSIEKLAVTVEDVEGGKSPAKIVAFLQTHPEIDYIQFTFGDLLPGVEAALQSAGMEGIKFTGVQSNPTIVKEVIDGKVAAWTAQPQQFQGWISTDAAIRVAQGLPLTKYEESGEIPTWVIDSKPAAEQVLEEGGEWPGPAGFEEKFEKLWGL